MFTIICRTTWFVPFSDRDIFVGLSPDLPRIHLPSHYHLSSAPLTYGCISASNSPPPKVVWCLKPISTGCLFLMHLPIIWHWSHFQVPHMDPLINKGISTLLICIFLASTVVVSSSYACIIVSNFCLLNKGISTLLICIFLTISNFCLIKNLLNMIENPIHCQLYKHKSCCTLPSPFVSVEVSFYQSST